MKGTFITRGAAREILGLTDYQFTKLERAGAVEGIILPGLKYKRYRRGDVERLANGEGTNEKRKTA